MKTFRNLLLELAAAKTTSAVTGHLSHIGELMYTGSPDVALGHLNATHDMLTGNPRPDHKLSIKADGTMSVIFGKKEGVPFVRYAKTANPDSVFQNEQQIIDFATTNNKPHYIKPLTASLTAAQNPKIERNHSFQADAIIDNTEIGSLKGNMVSYKKPSDDTRSILAVHGRFDSVTGTKIESNPDVSFLNTQEQHFPRLGLTNLPSLSPKNSSILKEHIAKAQTTLEDESVRGMLGEISSHVDPTNKLGSRSLFFVKFSNAVQRGSHSRTLEGFQKFGNDQIEKSKNADKLRVKAHLDSFVGRESTLQKIFDAHNSLDSARSIITKHISSGDLSLTPVTGEAHEGFVSELPGSMVKFVPSEFSKKNSEQIAKFKKPIPPVPAPPAAPFNEEVEKAQAPVVFYPGKFGTITRAHETMTKEGILHAMKIGATHFFHGPTSSKSHILNYEQKKSMLTKIVKPHIGDLSYGTTQADAITPFHGIEELIQKGHRNITVIHGSDRQDLRSSIEKHLTKNNGMWKSRTDELIPVTINFHEVGEKRGTGGVISEISGTRLREKVVNGNRDAAVSMMPSVLTPDEKSDYYAAIDAKNSKSIKIESIVNNMLSHMLKEDFEQFIKQSHGDKTQNITKGSLISDKMGKENIVPNGADPLEHFRSHISELSDQHKLWISKAYLNNDTKFEDLASGINLLKRHTELEKKGIRVASLKSFNRIPELHAHIGNVDPVKVAAPPESAVSPQEYAVHAENEHWKIIEPHTANASKHFGHGSNWCTSADCNNMFDDYRENGPMYIAVPKSPVGKEKERYILQVGDTTQELADYRNNTIEFKHIPKLEQRPFPKDSMFDLTQRVHKDPSSMDQMMNNPLAHQLIARHGTDAHRTALLARPDLNPDAHEKIAQYGNDDDRTELLKRPDLNPDTHPGIVRYGTDAHRTALLARPDLDRDLHATIAQYGTDAHRTALLARPDLNPDAHQMLALYGNNDHRTELLTRSDLHPDAHSGIVRYGTYDHTTELLKRPDLNPDTHWRIARDGTDDHRTTLLARPDFDRNVTHVIARYGNDDHRTALLKRPDLGSNGAHVLIAQYGNDDHRTALLARSDLDTDAHQTLALYGNNDHRTELLTRSDLHPDAHANIVQYGTDAHKTELLTRSDLHPNTHSAIARDGTDAHRTELLKRPDLNTDIIHWQIAKFGNNDHRTALLAKPDLNPDAHDAIAAYGNNDHRTALLSRSDLSPNAHREIARHGTDAHRTALLARPDLSPDAHANIAQYGTDAHRTALSTRSTDRVGSTVESETPIEESYKDKMRKFIKMLSEEGEASSGQMTSDGSGIAGLGDDARAGNVIVRKKPRMFKRRKR